VNKDEGKTQVKKGGLSSQLIRGKNKKKEGAKYKSRTEYKHEKNV